MPGPYAHITLVNKLSEIPVLNSMPDFGADARLALGRFFKYCELGAVSPDYPYLVKESNDAKKWADIMHYHGNGDMVKIAIEALKNMTGDGRDTCFAWLLGFVSHLGMDVTVHPVIELIGDYETNPTEHRACEMHQDVYIFDKWMKLGDLTATEHLDVGIKSCNIDTVKDVWKKMLEGTHPDEYANNEPDFDKWHACFKFRVEDLAGHLGKFFLFGRHTLEETGLLYPEEEGVDKEKYVNAVPGPEGQKTYDQVFDYAMDKVALLWQHLSTGVFSGSSSYQDAFGNWNLDRGISEKDWERGRHGQFIFWKGSL